MRRDGTLVLRQRLARLYLWSRGGGCCQSLVAALPSPLWSILDFWMCVALIHISFASFSLLVVEFVSYLVCVAEPRCALLLGAHQRNPVIATTAKALPNIRIAIHPPRLLRLVERLARRSADAMCEALVIPKGRVLENEPTSRLADSAPPLTLVSVTAYPLWSVQISIKSQFLLVRHQVRVRWVHVLGRRGDLLLVERSVQIWWV